MPPKKSSVPSLQHGKQLDQALLPGGSPGPDGGSTVHPVADADPHHQDTQSIVLVVAVHSIVQVKGIP